MAAQLNYSIASQFARGADSHGKGMLSMLKAVVLPYNCGALGTSNLFVKGGSAYRRYFFSTFTYDVTVVGGGPGGYVAAIKAAQLGLKTACIESRGSLGGTCLNVGCIPSKALLNISHKYSEMRHSFPKMGILYENAKLDLATALSAKDKAVKGLTGGIEFLFKKNKVDYIKGFGRLTSGTTIDIFADGSAQTSPVKSLDTKNIIIATGSEPSPLPGGGIVADEKVVVTSTGALKLSSVPKKLLIVGGGIIGLELGSVWSRFGADVQVVEFLDKICPTLDSEVSIHFQKILEKQGFTFKLSTKVVGADVRNNGATVHVESMKDNSKYSIEADIVLLSVGRRPFTQNLGLENLGIGLDKLKRIVVDEHFTVPNFPSIKAIGDVIAGPMLAHKAEEEGIAVVEAIAGKGPAHVNYDTIPSVVYSHPEVAGVGATEDELKTKKIDYAKGSFPFAANSRARTNNDSDGFVKILTDKATDKILGGWIIGPDAGELIQELVLGMEYGASSEDIARTCHAHPTLSEAVKEACMASSGKPIHFA